ncbi:hypothetical protein SAMN04488134_108122 [Amphibacillus marinus]|uniref:Uncharacterized protein n=1 Tax=Amphibacillus marinus TaxID=872970 RepID=A0A1H8QDN1_9BACI|nr:hypothetical protein [Amphibacillus marinus]SEO51994.1 hypothetical protein SAMN04488134_108122 [Amphibacillus marinus]
MSNKILHKKSQIAKMKITVTIVFVLSFMQFLFSIGADNSLVLGIITAALYGLIIAFISVFLFLLFAFLYRKLI